MSDELSKGNILLYQTQDGETKIEVTLSQDTVWLTADQMAELFQRNKSTISRHIKNVLESGELDEKSVVAKNATTASDGKKYTVAYYNLDMIISVGYRVNSYRGVQFRIWATKVLHEYLVKGFAMNDELLTHAGHISVELAKAKADAEYDKFKERTKNVLSPLEIHFIENFEKEQKRLRDSHLDKKGGEA